MRPRRERSGGGYGIIVREGRNWLVHRWVWTLANGPIPEGMKVLHRCDNPPCFRLDHLFLGTQKANVADMVDKGRHPNQIKTHCRHGHEFTPENTRIEKNGDRRCRTCDREATRRYLARRKQR